MLFVVFMGELMTAKLSLKVTRDFSCTLDVIWEVVLPFCLPLLVFKVRGDFQNLLPRSGVGRALREKKG